MKFRYRFPPDHPVWEVLGVILLFALVFICGAVVMWYYSYQCEAVASKMRLMHSWGMMQGCMVEVRGQWLPIEAIRQLP